MPRDGKYISCVVGTPDWPGVQEVSRTLCLTEGRGEVCRTCPRAQFKVRFPIHVGIQTVACPRWESELERSKKADPVDYVPVRRDTCITEKPFTFCVSCPNGRPSEVPRTLPRWFEEEERKKKLELELDEEERE